VITLGTCYIFLGLMDHRSKRNWKVLNWNIRGLNTPSKCNAVRSKIEESDCSIFCIQETKIQTIERSYIRKFAPKRFNKFAFSPTDGASKGGFSWVLVVHKPNRIICKRMDANYSSFYRRVFLALSNPRDRGRLALCLYRVITLVKEKLSLT
jgi:hypothetical protein